MINKEEAQQIAKQISPIFEGVLAEYSFEKYPAEEYEQYKRSFSALNPNAEEIEGAMVWKWGHFGKANYPEHHKELVRFIQALWPRFIVSNQANNPTDTFAWWRGPQGLNNQTRYITAAYITHLVHHGDPMPIIDQHNFRAMNALIASVQPGRRAKKKPSNWEDIDNLKTFMLSIASELHCTFPELDRFLMMYGRNHAPR